MPFPIGPDPRHNEPESNFVANDPFGLRRAVTPVFIRDLRDGMFDGCGTSFYITPFGRQLSAMHVTTDFFNARGISVRPAIGKTTIQSDDARIGILHDPGLVYGAHPAGKVLYVSDLVLFPVDQTRHPMAFTFSSDRLNFVEPELDLASWKIGGLLEQKTTFLPIRIGCDATVKEGDRVMALGYPTIRSWRKPRAKMVTYQEEMYGSIGRVIKVDREWNRERKIWPTMTVDVRWAPGMSGGPVFNEEGHVIGIVSRGADVQEDGLSWSQALWLEVLPYSADVFDCIDPERPGWISGWGVCNNPTSLVELFETKQAAEVFARDNGPGLTVMRASTPHSAVFSRLPPRGVN